MVIFNYYIYQLEEKVNKLEFKVKKLTNELSEIKNSLIINSCQTQVTQLDKNKSPKEKLWKYISEYNLETSHDINKEIQTLIPQAYPQGGIRLEFLKTH